MDGGGVGGAGGGGSGGGGGGGGGVDDVGVVVRAVAVVVAAAAHRGIAAQGKRVQGAKNGYFKTNLIFYTHTILNYHHHHLPNMQLGHLLTHSALTRLQVSLIVSPGSFCLLVCSFLLPSAVI